MTQTITVRLPRRLGARLNAAVKKRRTTRSAIVREALERHLSDPASKAEPSFLDLAREFVGSIEGPRDLSSDRRRLAGYGR